MTNLLKQIYLLVRIAQQDSNAQSLELRHTILYVQQVSIAQEITK